MVDWKQAISNALVNSTEFAVELDLESNAIRYSPKIKSNRKITSFTGDEEVARAFLVNHLVNDLGYKADDIELEKEYQYKTIGRSKQRDNRGRIDVILMDSSRNPFFFIEVKEPEKFEGDKKYIEGQLFNLAEEEQKKYKSKVKYLVYYTVEYENNILTDKAIIIDYTKYETYESWVDAGYPSLSNELPSQYNKPQKEPLTKGGKRDLKTSFSYRELQNLAIYLHNVLWGGGGTSDTEIFTSLVNIILAKIQDEYDTVDGSKYSFQIFQYGDEVEKGEIVFNRINHLYRKALKNQLYVDGDLSDQYVVNKQKFPLSKLVFTVGQLEQYSFVDGKSSLNGKDILGDFFEQIQRKGFRQTKGQFFTPVNLVKFMLYVLEIDELALTLLNDQGELPYIIDPSCGSGTFLIEAMKIITREVKYRRKKSVKSNRRVQDRFDELFKPDYREHRWARYYLYGIEHNFDLGTAAKVNMILHGDGSTNIFVLDGLLPFRYYEKESSPNYLNFSEQDPLYFGKEVNKKFGVVVSNPPFSVDLANETKTYLDSNFVFGQRKNSENLFIERYYQLLHDGGRLGVVLPESIYDTTENKYIRLFLYKYFHIRAVISLPQVAFEPHTPTKTSLLFAQKKTIDEVKLWNEKWQHYSSEWGKLKTRVENYIKVYIDDQDKNRFPSIKADNENTVRSNIARFIQIDFTEDDNLLSISDLLSRYDRLINKYLDIDKDIAEVFGFVNLLWVFEHTSRDLDQTIFMAEANNVGYKRRTNRSEKPMPNDLFDLEVAPNMLDKTRVEKVYNDDLVLLNQKKEKLELELSGLNENAEDSKRVQMLMARISRLNQKIESLLVEKEQVMTMLIIYYDEIGNLKEEYKDRLDPQLLQMFKLEHLESFRSEDILIRSFNHQTILDFIRNTGIWK